jgi:hypothetical protein
MKKLLLLTGMITLILSMSGCLSTLYPLFTEKDLVYDARLIGEWKEKADDGSMVIEKASLQDLAKLPALQQLVDKAYIISLKSKEADVNSTRSKDQLIEQKFIAFLTRLGTDLYLDFFPTPTDRQQQYDGFYITHFISMHSFYRVQVHNDRSIEISQLKEEYLKNLIQQKRVRIKHEVYIDGSYIITAPTEELQQYVLKYGSVPEAYDGNTVYTKIQSL